VADAFDALGDPTRRRILELLRERGSMSAGELAAGFSVSRPAVSQHLAVLRSAQLVRVRPDGTRRLYSLHPSGLTALRAWVEGFWTVVLADFADEVARRTPPGPAASSRTTPSRRSSPVKTTPTTTRKART
jgi:DNA-binding transcriptional ArsR family regulator